MAGIWVERCVGLGTCLLLSGAAALSALDKITRKIFVFVLKWLECERRISWKLFI